MSTNIATASVTDATPPSLDTILPVSRREIYWRPKFMAESAFLDHLPVLFWLMGDLRPKSVVVLGGGADGSAVAHLALCQAVERLGLDADCTGIGTWPGTDDVPPEPIADYADTQYGEFSRLISVPDKEAPGLFDAGSVDLLVVDRDLTPEVLDMLAGWDGALSDGACIVLRGTETARRTQATAAALDSFRAGRPAVRFSHGGGLWVTAAGETLPGRLARMVTLEEDRALFRSVQRIFQRLGAACANEWTARHATRVENAASRELSTLRAAFEKRGADFDRLEKAAAETERANQDRISALTAETARLTRSLEAAEYDLATLRESRDAKVLQFEAELVEIRAETEALRARLAESEAEAEALRTQLAESQQAAAAPGVDSEALTMLTGLLAEGEEREAALARELAERAGAASSGDLQAAQARIATLEDEKARILAETDRARTALENDSRRASEDRAAAMRTIAELRAALRDAGTGQQDTPEAIARRDLALGEAVQIRDRLEEEANELRRASARQAQELAQMTRIAKGGSGSDARAAELAERAAAELTRAENEARDLATALRQSQEARAAADTELERTRRELARMKGRKEHLENRIRTELGG